MRPLVNKAFAGRVERVKAICRARSGSEAETKGKGCRGKRENDGVKK